MSDVNVSLGLDDSKFTSKLNAADRQVKGFSSTATASFNGMQAGIVKAGESVESLNQKFSLLSKAIVGAGIIEFTRTLLSTANELNDTAVSLDTTIERLMEMQTAAATSGGSIEGMTKMLQKLQIAVGDAAAGSDSLRGTFESLGQNGQTLAASGIDIQFYNIAKALAAMGPGAEQAAKANEIFGKTSRGFDWGGYVKKIEASYGSMTELGAAQKKAADISESLNNHLMLTKAVFTDMLSPILNLVGPTGSVSDQMAAAERTAKILYGALILFGTAATLNAFGTIAKSAGVLTSMMQASVVPTEVATVAITNQSRALGSFLSGAYARVGSATAAAEVATINYNKVLAANGPTAEVTALAHDKLVAAQARLAVAQEAAAATGQAAAASLAKIDAMATALPPVVTGAAVATTGFTAALSRMSAAVATALGPLNAFLLLGGSLYAVYQMIFGEDGLAKGGGGANWISDMVGVTDAAERLNQKLEQQNQKIGENKELTAALAKAEEEAKRQKAWAASQAAKALENEADKIKAVNAAMTAGLSASQERIKLQIQYATKSKEEQTLALAQFDAKVKASNELLKVDQQIADQKAKLSKKDISSAEVTQIKRSIAALENQKEIIKQIEMAASGIVTLELERNAALSIQNSYLESQKKAQDIITSLKKESAQMTMTESERRISDLKYQIEEEQNAALLSFEAARGRKANLEEEAQIRNKVSASYDGVINKTQQVIDQSRLFSTGWSRAMKQYVDDTTDGAKRAEEVFQKATKGMEDAIIGFAKTGKFEFNDMLNSIVEMLLRSEIQNTMAKVFSSSSGGKNNGSAIGGFIGGLLGFAGGGIIPTNSPVLVGERGPEIISGAAGRSVTPNDQIGGSTNVTYNINAVDARSFQQLVAQDPEFIYAVTLRGQRSMPGGIR